MKIALMTAVAFALLIGAGSAGAAGVEPSRNPAMCQVNFNQSAAAAAGCRTPGGFGFNNGICSFTAYCPRADGSEERNPTSIRLEYLPSLKNCNGRLGFVCD